MFKSTTDQVLLAIYGAAVLGLLTERVLHLGMLTFNREIGPFETPFNRAIRLIVPVLGIIVSGGFMLYLQSKFGWQVLSHQMGILSEKIGFFATVGWMIFVIHAIVVVLSPIFLIRQVQLFRRRAEFVKLGYTLS
ncbi:MAG: hypothetical protein WCI47_00040 [bacterium]